MAAALVLAPMARANTAEPLSDTEVDRRYNKLVDAERTRVSKDQFAEKIASGIAALGIGLYGYYNDDRGVLTRLIYSGTQTAGVLMISGAIHDTNHPSLLLLSDRYLNRRGSLNLDRFKRGIVLIEEKRVLGEHRRNAYTAAILATMYGYNGYRERNNSNGLKNVFAFLAFNFTLISGASFYRLYTYDGGTKLTWLDGRMTVAAVPQPTITITF